MQRQSCCSFAAGRRALAGGMAMALGAGLSLAGLPAQAATVATDFNAPVFQQGQRLSDEELARLRGKFVNAREVLFFGVEMSTQWRTGRGEALYARADLGFDLSGAAASPTFNSHITTTTPEAYAAYQAASATSQQVVDLGSRNARGVVQLVQAGGDFNTADNQFWIDAGPDIERSSGPANGRLSATTPDGAMVSIGKQSGGLAMLMSVPGVGQSSQELLARQGLHQSIQLASDHQQISNVTRLRIQLGQGGSNRELRRDVKRLLDATRGLERLR